jgi:hypothetical protein
MVMQSISLRYQSATDDYLVVTVTNSLLYNPGASITRAQAQALVDDATWQVIVTQPPPTP